MYMKAIHKLIGLLGLGSMLALGGCSKGYEYEAPANTFRVVKTTLSPLRTASEGTIEVTEEGFEVKTDVSWITASKAGATTVKVMLSENTTLESRTGHVILSKGRTTHSIPVTQFGRINKIKDLQPHTFAATGGSHSYAVELYSEPTITYSDGADWVEHSLADGILTFTAQSLADASVSSRETTATITAGLLVQTVVLRQAMSYSDFAGDYTLSYTEHVGGEAKQADVSLVIKEAGKSFTLRGLAHDLTLLWIPETSSLRLHNQVFKPGDRDIWMLSWLAGEGGRWHFSGNTAFYFESTWDGNAQTPGFGTFKPSTNNVVKVSGTDYAPRGIIFWQWLTAGGDGEYKGDNGTGISRIVDLSLRKK